MSKLSENISLLSRPASDLNYLADLKQAAEWEIEIQESSPSLASYKRARTLDSSRWYMGSLLTFLAESKQTGGAFSLVEGLLKRGNEPPPHVHQHEDELYYVLEGELDAYVGPEVFRARAGECFFFPRRTPHGFVIRSPRLRVLVFISPAGFEEYFRAMSSPAGTLDLPHNSVTYSQGTPEQAVQKAEELGLRFLTPDEIAEQLPSFPG